MKVARSVLLFLLVALTGPAKCFFIRKHVFVDRLLSWTEAQTYCRTNYVDLSTVNTPGELSRFKTNMEGHSSEWIWIGLSKQATEKVFTQWSDGSALGIITWGGADTYLAHCVFISNYVFYKCICGSALRFSCYTWQPRMVVVQEMKTWTEALEHCRNVHTDLISLNTYDDLLLANNRSLSSKTPSVWVGLRFLDGSWFWVNKEPLGNLVNLPSCPTGPHLCGAKKVGEDAWENRDCEEKMNFMCYQQ